MKSKKNLLPHEKICPDCGELISSFANTELIQKLLSELMAGEELSTEQLKLLSSVPTTDVCWCKVNRGGVLNWPNVNQLKAILIPD